MRRLMQRYFVTCDNAGCENGYIGTQQCAKCEGLGNIPINDTEERRMVRNVWDGWLRCAAAARAAWQRLGA